MAAKELFNKFSCALFKTAMNSEVVLKTVTPTCLELIIDEESVLVTYDNKGLKIRCCCKACGKALVARDCICRRRLRAIHYLFRYSGEISEIQVKI